jgi:hypothetical protein
MKKNKTTEITTKELNAKILQFSAHITAGMESWMSAGKILVEILEADPNAYNYITHECPQITPGMLRTFERIGRGLLLPALALESGSGPKMLRNLPLSQQERFMKEPVPLVVHTKDGKTDTLLVHVKDMTKEQAQQAFANDHIRTLGEQKAVMIQRDSKAATVHTGAATPAWTIKGGKVVFERQVTLTARELGMIISQLK